ncbi:HEAT repeat domain-containing protein [Allomuricauda sp. SCSIO 65647]|uniref:HEAT repeat domain-containing protein n=1 Tax=Allomuricauda sp. SCSIO 65647 TaxID=2908843 RepID=UPI001F2CDC2F|nr:HEAT repeat domain-containing protein [Muricauda sp. SCSIO 65647]UJH67282.1 hypothetical protein L0P89_15190 [Muricauda sp. SCSIO 65647]
MLGVLYFFFIFFFKRKISLNVQKLSTKKKELAPIISNFLFHDDKGPVEEQKSYIQLKIEIRDALKNHAFRKILSEILLDLEKDVSGETRKKLHRLYDELGLHLDAYRKLKSWRWEIVSQGILELTQMQRVDAYPFITKFLNDRRSVIRKQAEISTVSLKPEGISHFLDTTRYGISEWQQLKIMEELRGMENFRPPRFATWLISRNRDVVLFSLRLMRHYNQNNAEKSIIELIKHKDDYIKSEAICCIKEFCMLKALKPLKAVFRSCSEMVKIEILDAIATLGSESEIEFLLKAEKHEPSFMVRTKALTAINDLVPDTIIPTKDIMSKFKKDTKDRLDKKLKAFVKNAKDENGTVEDSGEAGVENINDDELSVDIEVFEIDPDTISIKEEEREDDGERIMTFDHDKTDFEIGPIEQGLDDAINTQLGLVNAEAEEEQKPQGENDLKEEYQRMSPPEREMLIDTLEVSNSDRDIPVLEDLIEQEESSESGFRIFKMLKNLKSPSKEIPPVEEEPFYDSKELLVGANDSIFYPLFEYATDQVSKMALLKEMASVGDERDLAMLEELSQDEDPKLAKQAKDAKEKLLKKLTSEESLIEEDPEKSTVRPVTTEKEPLHSEELEEAIMATGVEKSGEDEDGLMPMELCFLHDEFGIDPSREEDDELNFELADEFFLHQDGTFSD